MAFVDDDDAKGILAVVLGQKAGKPVVLVVQPEGLISGDMDTGVGGGIAAFFGLDDADVVAEGGLELGIGLLAQLVAVAEEERRFGQLPGLPPYDGGLSGRSVPPGRGFPS